MRVPLLTYVSVSLFSCADLVSGFQSGFSPLTSPLLKTIRHDGSPQFISTYNPHVLARKDTYLKSSDKNQPPENSEGLVDKTGNNVDDLFDPKTTVFLVGGQSLLIAIAAGFATIFNVPNYGFGPQIEFSVASVQQGFLMALPLGVFAFVLDLFEDKVPALQEVSKATQKSVLALLGGTFKPVLGLLISLALGLAAGFGEEMLFRGILQSGLASQMGNVAGVIVASVIFGALHAVTPMYAFLAWLASLYFGYLYLASGNLAVPIFTHAIYDVGALFYAHWTISKLSAEKKSELANL